jgi:hypothetical protein
MRDQSFWIGKARRLALRRNLACWLELFLPLACGIAVAGAIALLVLRILKFPVTPFWIAVGGILLAGVAVTAWLSSRRFFTTNDALTRLDEVGRLHNRLTAAQAGVGDWPAPRELKDGAHWNLSRLLGPIALSIFVLTGAAWVNVPDRRNHDRVVEPPLAWGQVDSWLQTLDQSQLIQPESLEKLRAEMDELRQQPAENWYSQSSLEASDTLREKTEQALKSMLMDMQKADDAVAAAGKLGQTSPPGELKSVNESLQNALHGLEMGNLPMNKEMLSELKKIDAAKLKQIDPKLLAEMQQKLKAGMKACEKCLGPSVRPGKEISMQAGGEGGGGKPAPLTLKKSPTDLRSENTDTVSSDDVSHAALGDVTGINKGEHDVKKKAPKGPVTGGSIESNGQGGEAVWRDSLTPEEQKVLQRFFK